MSALVLQLAREGLWLALLLSAPPVLAAWLAGLLVGLFQTATQIHDPTVSFVPRLLAVTVTLVALGPTLAAHLLSFAGVAFLAIAQGPGGGR